MTYGWAVLVVLAAISALAYFGVLSPDRLVPRRCLAEPGIGCIDYEIGEESVTVALRNAKGESINIVELKVEGCAGAASGILKDQELARFTIDGCDNQVYRRFNGRMNITYFGSSGVTHIGQGSIIGRVEPTPGNDSYLNGSFYWITTTQQEFDAGSYSQTASIGAGSVQLIAAQGSGVYTSRVFDAGRVARWNNISWGEPMPYKEPLMPDGTGCGGSSVKGLWHLDEGAGTAIDSSYCGKNGNTAGAVQGVSGKIGTAYEFDGINDYVDMDSSLFPPVPPRLTVTLWAKTNETGNLAAGKGNTAFYHGWDGEFVLGQDFASDKTFFAYDWVTPSDNSPHWAGIVGTTPMVRKVWYHIAVTWDSISDRAELYVNGVLENQTTLGAEWELRDAVTYHPTTIGANTQIYGRDYLWNGTLDEVSVYNRVLSPQEILDDYKRGILNLSIGVRSCDDPNCDGETFSSLFTNSTPQSLNVVDNRYFQYKVILESEDATYTPLLEDVTVGYTIS